MGTPEKYSENGMREGHPGNINPNEFDRKHPAKDIPQQEKLDINQSESGRNQGHRQSEEIIDDNISQIDSETKQLQDEKNEHDETMAQTLKKEFDTDDFNRVDERDNEDSSEDWDAEKSRTGRQK